MLFLVMFVLLLIGNWLLSNIFVFVPLNIVDRAISLGWLGAAFVLLLFLTWCLGDD